MRETTTGRAWVHVLRFLRPYRWQLCAAVFAVALEALISVFRPWPLKVVIDRVLSHKPSRLPLLGAWLDSTRFSEMVILFGACAATLLMPIFGASSPAA